MVLYRDHRSILDGLMETYEMGPIDIDEIQVVSIGYSEGTWVLSGKIHDEIYVLAEGKLNDMTDGCVVFKRVSYAAEGKMEGYK